MATRASNTIATPPSTPLLMTPSDFSVSQKTKLFSPSSFESRHVSLSPHREWVPLGSIPPLVAPAAATAAAASATAAAKRVRCSSLKVPDAWVEEMRERPPAADVDNDPLNLRSITAGISNGAAKKDADFRDGAGVDYFLPNKKSRLAGLMEIVLPDKNGIARPPLNDDEAVAAAVEPPDAPVVREQTSETSVPDSSGGSGSSSTAEAAADETVRVSKQLSWLLRHGANRVGLELDDDGFLDVDAVLKLPEFEGVSLDFLVKIVKENDKQRFALKSDEATGLLKIRANQGHSIKVGSLDIKRITVTAAMSHYYDNVIHGTSVEAWESIKKSGGLSRMTRNHIHFAMGKPGNSRVCPGIRSNSSVLIYINVAAAIRDSFQFFISTNKVILTPGDVDGRLPIKYFLRVVQLRPEEKILFPEETESTATPTVSATAAATPAPPLPPSLLPRSLILRASIKPVVSSSSSSSRPSSLLPPKALCSPFRTPPAPAQLPSPLPYFKLSKSGWEVRRPGNKVLDDNNNNDDEERTAARWHRDSASSGSASPIGQVDGLFDLPDLEPIEDDGGGCYGSCCCGCNEVSGNYAPLLD